MMTLCPSELLVYDTCQYEKKKLFVASVDQCGNVSFEREIAKACDSIKISPKTYT